MTITRFDNLEQVMRELAFTHSSVTIGVTDEEAAKAIREIFRTRNVLKVEYSEPDLCIHYDPEAYRLVVINFKKNDLGLLARSQLRHVTPMIVCSEEQFEYIKDKLGLNYSEEEVHALK